MLRNPLLWFHPTYRGFLKLTFSSIFDTTFESLLDPHVPQPYKTTTLREVWQQFPAELNATTHRKFRNREDVNQWLFRYWRIVRGEFHPRNLFQSNAVFFSLQENWQALTEAVKSPSVKIVTINDTDKIINFKTFAAKTKALFQDILPKASQFETSYR